MQHTIFIVFYEPTSPAPSPPSAVSVSQNGLDSVLVSWTPPSGEPDVTGYIIYYQQDGGQRLSENVGAAATTATITGLITGAIYSVSMMATSSILLSTETAAQTVIIGNNWTLSTTIVFKMQNDITLAVILSTLCIEKVLHESGHRCMDKENMGRPNPHCK